MLILLYLRNLKLHKICLTPHIMGFRINMFGFSLVSLARKALQQAIVRGRLSNELFRYLFVIS